MTDETLERLIHAIERLTLTVKETGWLRVQDTPQTYTWWGTVPPNTTIGAETANLNAETTDINACDCNLCEYASRFRESL